MLHLAAPLLIYAEPEKAFCILVTIVTEKLSLSYFDEKKLVSIIEEDSKVLEKLVKRYSEESYNKIESFNSSVFYFILVTNWYQTAFIDLFKFDQSMQIFGKFLSEGKIFLFKVINLNLILG